MARSRVRSVSRKNTPLSPPKASLATTAPNASNQNKRKTRSANREITAAQQQLQHIETDLQPVVEHEEELLPQPTRAEDDVSSLLDASSTGSSLQELLDALDRDAIIDNLQNLYDDSIHLMSLFEDVDDQTLASMCNPTLQSTLRLHKRLQSQKHRLLATRENYSTNRDDGGLDFIKPDLILRKMLGLRASEGFADGPWRPDAILHLANLALQVVKVLSSSMVERVDYLDHIFDSFPEQFIDFDHFKPSLETYEGMHDLHVELLTQVYLNMVESERDNEDFDPDQVLAEVWFDEESRVKASSDPDGRLKAIERTELIRSHFDSESEFFINIDGLKEQFPWSKLAVQAVRWTLALKKELKEFIKSRGGVEKMADLLLAGSTQGSAAEDHELDTQNDESEQRLMSRSRGNDLEAGNARQVEIAKTATVRFTGQALDEQRHNAVADDPEDTHSRTTHSLQNPAGGPMRGSTLKSNLTDLKALKAQFAARKSGVDRDVADQDESDFESDHEVAQSLTPADDDEADGKAMKEESQPMEDEDQGQDHAQADEEDEEVIATQQAMVVIETAQHQSRQSNKENARGAVKKPSFLDRQEGAERVQWDPSYPDDEELYQSRRRSPKRSRHHADADSEEDEAEFETDTRAAKRPRVIAGRSNKRAPTRIAPPDVEEDIEETNRDDGDRRTQPQTLASRPRPVIPRPAAREPHISPEQRRPAFPSSSAQPEQNIQRSSSSRAPLQQIYSGSQGMHSSNAPTRSDQNTIPTSLQPSRRPTPPHQGSPRASSRQRSPSQEPPSTQAHRVNQEAKERVQMARDLAQNRRRPQTRIPYSVDEVDRLMEMIALYNTKWARILVEDRNHPDGAKLQGRSQVQLKDKARNIKMDWLKSGKRLEPGFEAVSVGASMIQSLTRLGINYFEGDDAARYVGRGGGSDDDDIEY